MVPFVLSARQSFLASPAVMCLCCSSMSVSTGGVAFDVAPAPSGGGRMPSFLSSDRVVVELVLVVVVAMPTPPLLPHATMELILPLATSSSV